MKMSVKDALLIFIVLTAIDANAVHTQKHRVVALVNQCPFPVWFGFISGATASKNGKKGCSSDNDCYAGSVCVDRGAGGTQCFWENPKPSNDNYQLNANGGTNFVQIPIYNNGLNSTWSGAVAGRTNCTNGSCETGDCAGGTKGCPPGKGFNPPVTIAEFTFNNQARDYYDVEVINGINIPVEMSPNNKNTSNSDPYYCGNPGGAIPITTVGACQWNITPPSNDYKWVTKGGAVCSDDGNCQLSQVCGLSFDPQKTPQLQKTCGKLLGFWSADQVCAINQTYGAPFNCAMPLPAPEQHLSLFNLYGCAPTASCYQDNAKSNCCGCVNWDQIGIDVPPSPATKQCNNSNPFWATHVLPKLVWMKQACPTVYTYPYDDMSSTFTCDKMEDGLNTANYTITFCPGGLTGRTGLNS